MSQRHLSDIIRLIGSRLYILLAGSILMVFLARWLTPNAFGEYQLIVSLAMIFPVVVDWGISNSLPRYLAEFRSGEVDRVRPALIAGIQIKLTALLVGGLILVALKEPLSQWLNLDSVAHLLPLGLLILLGLSLNDFFLKLSEGFQRFEAVPIVTFLKNTGDLVLSLGLILLGYGLAGALAGKMAATLFAAGVGLTWLVRTASRTYPRSVSAPPGLKRKILAYGTWLVLIDVADRILIFGDRLLINHFLGPEMVGLYSVPARMAALSQVVGLSVASVIGPAMARDPEGSLPALRASLRFLSALYGLIAVLILGLGDRIVLLLFGDAYAGSIPSLRIFAVIIPLMGISPVFSLVLNYRGAARRRVAFIVMAMTVTVAGNLILIPRIGILGSAIALGIGQFVYVWAQGAFFNRVVSLDGFWVPLLAKVIAISLGSLAVMVLIREMVPGSLSPWVAGLVVSLGYGLALFKWGVVSRAELRRLLPTGSIQFRG